MPFVLAIDKRACLLQVWFAPDQTIKGATAMTTSIFVSYPTADLERSKAFYTALGATIDPLFTDENAACLAWDENIYLMVLKREFFATLHRQAVGRPGNHRTGPDLVLPRLQGGGRRGGRGGPGRRWFRTATGPGPRVHVQP